MRCHRVASFPSEMRGTRRGLLHCPYHAVFKRKRSSGHCGPEERFAKGQVLAPPDASILVLVRPSMRSALTMKAEQPGRDLGPIDPLQAQQKQFRDQRKTFTGTSHQQLLALTLQMKAKLPGKIRRILPGLRHVAERPANLWLLA